MKFLERYLLRRPQRYQITESIQTHGQWKYVTDSMGILGVRTGDRAVPLSENKVKYQEVVERFLAEPVPDTALFGELPDLWRFLDNIVRLRCSPCGGLGVYASWETGELVEGTEFTCADCDGRGWGFGATFTDSNPVSVADLPIDHSRLAYWLPTELADMDESCRVFASSILPAVVVTSARWRVVCMGIARDRAPARYRSYLPGSGVWNSYRHDPDARAAGTDWAIEQGADGFDVFGSRVWEGRTWE